MTTDMRPTGDEEYTEDAAMDSAVEDTAPHQMNSKTGTICYWS